MIIHCRKNTNFYNPKIIRPKNQLQPRCLARTTQNSSISRIQGPVACTLWTNEISSSEFCVIPSIALNQTFIHCRQYKRTQILSISSSKTLDPVPQVMNRISQSEIWTYVSQLPISDVRMHWLHTCVCRNTRISAPFA